MEIASNLLIVVDSGHGGKDPGAVWGDRLEKDDNLRLGLLVRDVLQRHGVNVLMTRDDDSTISLQERVRLANSRDADLFLSLHRNSYERLTPDTKGVENFIYLTAPAATTGRAAELVLQRVVDVGVQGNRGVKRGNYYVLRRSRMPAMLLEMGFIINEEDNRLFDQNLNQYAEAIAQGILEYFNLPYLPPGAPPAQTLPEGLPPVTIQPMPQPAPQPMPSTPAGLISLAQSTLNSRFGFDIPITSSFDSSTRHAVISLLQTELNRNFNSGLTVDGIYGPATRVMLKPIGPASPGNLPIIAQLLLLLHGYNPGQPDNIYGPMTMLAMQMFQQARFLPPVGIATPETLNNMLTH